jgi:riboflavin kinase/FMN adenylyltransferase
LAPERSPRYLTTPGEKIALLEKLGVDIVVLLEFNQQLAAAPARDFAESLSSHLRMCELWVGLDFALGRNRQGDVAVLRELGRELGYDLRAIGPIEDDGHAISSSRIRGLLKAGNVKEATRLLGRYPSVSGQVVFGARRGTGIGFATANLEVRPERAVPADGVYAVFAVLGRDRYPAVANVGVRPSFDNGERTVETHIFDFDRDIYGCDVVVEFVARLRAERRFESVEELVAQIERDIGLAKQHLSASAWSGVSRESSIRTVGLPTTTCDYWYEEIEHTADRALRVWGKEASDLFTGAALGMYSLMADVNGLVATDWHEIRVESWDRESILVSWLNELLYLSELEERVFVDFQIESLTDTALRAQAGAIAVPITKAKIKAATFHDLALVEHGDGWSTVITFDV